MGLEDAIGFRNILWDKVGKPSHIGQEGIKLGWTSVLIKWESYYIIEAFSARFKPYV